MTSDDAARERHRQMLRYDAGLIGVDDIPIAPATPQQVSILSEFGVDATGLNVIEAENIITKLRSEK